MIDHIVIGVSDYEKSKQFYRAVLEPIGYKLLMEIEGWAGFGADKAEFWFNQVANPGTAYHFAFSSPDRKAVDEFYHAALQAGG
ncbi:MAG: VOC family protein, partial [Gammaproteobacteria bacterium]|nr:VOC family protein [Gammaproteobacteria bacterium]